MSARSAVVYDCNTFLQALAAPEGPAGHCVQMAIDGVVRLFVSPVVIDELRTVAARPKVIARMRLVTERVEAFLDTIQLAATVLSGFDEPFAYDRDADDAHYINLALAAGASFIVTRDNDVLDLMDASRTESREFQARFPTLQIVNPVRFLRETEASM